MALVEYVDLDEIDSDRIQADKGSQRPSLFLRALANNPRVLDLHWDYHEGIMHQGNVDRKLKEIAHVTVSYTNECDYCAAAHTERLIERLDLHDDETRAITESDFSNVNDATTAVIQLAEQMAADPKRVSEDHIDALRGAGFSEADVIEIVEQCAEAVASNTIVDSLDVLADDYEDAEGNFDLLQHHPDNYG